jgi:hypothetical protein
MSWGRPVTEMSAGWTDEEWRRGRGESSNRPAVVLLAGLAVVAVFYFSPRAWRANVRAPTQIYVGCAGTARSADNLKGAGNRCASMFI